MTEKYSNGFTQKELNIMVLEKLDQIEEKLEAKLDKAEFYKVLTLLVAVGGVVAAIILKRGIVLKALTSPLGPQGHYQCESQQTSHDKSDVSGKSW